VTYKLTWGYGAAVCIVNIAERTRPPARCGRGLPWLLLGTALDFAGGCAGVLCSGKSGRVRRSSARATELSDLSVLYIRALPCPVTPALERTGPGATPTLLLGGRQRSLLRRLPPMVVYRHSRPLRNLLIRSRCSG